MNPALDNGGRWHHIASDAEVDRAMRDKSCDVIEAPVIGCTFLLSAKYLTIIRAGAMGGDVRAVEGGWVYPHNIAMMLDALEIRQVANVRVGA